MIPNNYVYIRELILKEECWIKTFEYLSKFKCYTVYKLILQLPGSAQFKPHVLCVDNSFICDTRQDKDSEPLRTWVRSQVGF
jgi:hypothetical protein